MSLNHEAEWFSSFVFSIFVWKHFGSPVLDANSCMGCGTFWASMASAWAPNATKVSWHVMVKSRIRRVTWRAALAFKRGRLLHRLKNAGIFLLLVFHYVCWCLLKLMLIFSSCLGCGVCVGWFLLKLLLIFFQLQQVRLKSGCSSYPQATAKETKFRKSRTWTPMQDPKPFSSRDNRIWSK